MISTIYICLFKISLHCEGKDKKNVNFEHILTNLEFSQEIIYLWPDNTEANIENTRLPPPEPIFLTDMNLRSNNQTLGKIFKSRVRK